MSGIVKLACIAVFAICLAGMTARIASAQQDAAASYSTDYPGVDANGEFVFDTGLLSVSLATQAYYKAYGIMPSSWQQVRDRLVWQVDLHGYNMDLIDPDDPELDFPGDLHYQPVEAGSAIVRVLEFVDGNLQEVSHTIDWDYTYYEQFAVFDAHAEIMQQVPMQETYIPDRGKLIQFSHLGSIRILMDYYKATHGEYPSEIGQFLEWGIGPLAPGSTNPVTGEAYAYDGSEGDVSYMLQENGAVMLRHFDEHRMSFTY